MWVLLTKRSHEFGFHFLENSPTSVVMFHFDEVEAEVDLRDERVVVVAAERSTLYIEGALEDGYCLLVFAESAESVRKAVLSCEGV